MPRHDKTIPGLRREQMPWYHSWKNAYRRCTDPKNNRHQYYGAKGIKFELPFWETGWLYVRDNASSMRRPQIHRMNSKGNYNLRNCEFIELEKHCSLTHKGSKRSEESRRRMSLAGGTQFGSKHPMSKLTEAQVLEIRKTTGSCAAVGKKFGVHLSLVSLIRRRCIWTHI